MGKSISGQKKKASAQKTANNCLWLALLHGTTEKQERVHHIVESLRAQIPNNTTPIHARQLKE